MIVIDIGNTNIVIGHFFKNHIKTYRYKTYSKKTFQQIKNKFNNKFIKKAKTRNCIISSVVPMLNSKIYNIFNKNGFRVSTFSSLKKFIDIKFNIDKFEALGEDRIYNSIAGVNKYGKNCLIVDFGTATTFDVIRNNIYEGGIIAPGIEISHDALINKASKLKKISIIKTKKIVGKNTINAMQSGFFWGYLSLINQLLEKIILEKKYKPTIILTGGLAPIFKDEINFKPFYEPNLTLEGMYFIGIKKYAK